MSFDKNTTKLEELLATAALRAELEEVKQELATEKKKKYEIQEAYENVKKPFISELNGVKQELTTERKAKYEFQESARKGSEVLNSYIVVATGLRAELEKVRQELVTEKRAKFKIQEAYENAKKGWIEQDDEMKKLQEAYENAKDVIGKISKSIIYFKMSYDNLYDKLISRVSCFLFFFLLIFFYKVKRA